MKTSHFYTVIGLSGVKFTKENLATFYNIVLVLQKWSVSLSWLLFKQKLRMSMLYSKSVLSAGAVDSFIFVIAIKLLDLWPEVFVYLSNIFYNYFAML